MNNDRKKLRPSIVRPLDLDRPNVVLAADAPHIEARHDVEREIRKSKFFDLVVGTDADGALGGDVVADHLEVLQFGVAVLALDDIGVHGRCSAGRLVPMEMIENDFVIGQVSVQFDRGLGPVAALQRYFDRDDAMHEIVDVEPELRAIGFIELRNNLQRRLLTCVSAKNPLADNLGRDAVHQQITLGIKRCVRSN